MRITETFSLCYVEVGVRVADVWLLIFKILKFKNEVKTPYTYYGGGYRHIIFFFFFFFFLKKVKMIYQGESYILNRFVSMRELSR